MDKFAHMVHYFIWRGEGVPTLGKTVLCKLCYFSDFDFYELNERSITGRQYSKLPQGPMPYFFDDVITELIRNGCIDAGSVKDVYKQYRYRPLKEPDMSIFDEDEIEMMRWEFDRLGKKTAAEVSELSHKDIPWIIADNKGIISYEAVFFRDAITSVRDEGDIDETAEIKLISNIGRFIFDPPLTCIIRADADGYALDTDDGRFHEIGSSEEDLMAELEDSLEFVWRKYVKGDPEQMADSAVAYRKWLMSRMSEG